MKRIFAAVLALVMALSMAAFAEEPASIAGKWYTTEIDMLEGEEWFTRDSLLVGFSAMLELYEEGDGFFYLNRNAGCAESYIDWTFEDDVLTLTLESGDQMTMKMEDGRLVQNINDVQYLYYENDVERAPEMPAKVTGVEMKDFKGEWIVERACQYGFALDVAVLGLSGMEFSFDGKDDAVIQFPTYETQAEESQPLEYTEISLEDDVLILNGGAINMTLREDGTIRAEILMAMGSVDVILAKK